MKILQLVWACILLTPFAGLSQSAPTIESLIPEGSILHVDEGKSFELQVVASGTGLTYQWYSYSGPIKGATAATLSVQNASNNNAYSVIVGNADGETKSKSIFVAVRVFRAPEITWVTPDFTLNGDGPVILEARWRGALPVTIEWSKDSEVVQTGSSNRLMIENPAASDGGFYTVKLTSPYGNAQHTIAVSPLPASSIKPPTFRIPPADVTAQVDATNVSTAFVPEGTLPITCELLQNGAIVSSTIITDPRYYVYLAWPQLKLSHFGGYAVRLTNSAGSTTSEPVALRRQPLQAPSFSTYNTWAPERTYTLGSWVSMQQPFTGSTPITYQWFKDGNLIEGVTGTHLSFSNASAADSGWYTIKADNRAGQITSPPMKIQIIASETNPPSFSRYPPSVAEQSIGDEILLSSYSLHLSGTTPLTYQWYRGEHALSGQTNSSLAFTLADEADFGSYFLSVSNAYGSAHFHVATLVPRTPRPPVFYTNLPRTLAFSPSGPNRSLYIYATGQPSFSYQWYRDGELIEEVNGSELVLGQSYSPVGGDYHVVVSNADGSSSSSVCSVVQFTPDPPVFRQHPDQVHFYPGEGLWTRFLEVKMLEEQPGSYSWFKDGNLLDMQNSDRLYLPDDESAAGSYHAVFSNAAGSVTSETAHVTYGPTPPTPFTRISGSHTLRYIGFFASPLHYSPLYFETTAAPLTTKWFRNGVELAGQDNNFLKDDFSDDLTGMYQIRITTADGDFESPIINVFALDEAALPSIHSGSARFTRAIGESLRLETLVTSPTPLTFQWLLNGTPMPGANTATLTFDRVKESDLGTYIIRATNKNGTRESAPILLDSPPIEAPVVFTPITSLVAETHQATYEAPWLSVYVPSENTYQYQWFKDGTWLKGITNDQLNLNTLGADMAGDYQVKVSNSVGSTWSEAMRVTINENPAPFGPQTHPSRYSVGLGESLALSAPTTGNPYPLAYQWQLNGADIPGATRSQLQLANLTPAQTGTYAVRLSDGVRSTTRDVAIINSTNAFSPLHARHRIIGNGIFADRPITINTRLTHPGDLTAASYSLLLPTGWSLASQTATGTSVAPAPGETDLLEWRWTSPPPSPFNFEFTLTPPASPTGTEELAALLESTREFLDFQALAMPDPLILQPVPNHHTADTDQDARLSLSELLRVIELYNTRNGSTRTGRYSLSDTTDDGFAPDPAQAATTESTVRRIHLADTDWDGALSLSELLRVIELYNTRTGTTRTGAYQRATGTTDGFAPSTGE
jgi:hypothetical protein